MPFTLSHPAAIIPFHRYVSTYTSVAALVIGSMSPDFVYFLPLGVKGPFSHSLQGLFLFCLPAGLFVYVLFYLLLRQPLHALMPQAIASRLTPQPEWRPRSLPKLFLIACSVVIGAATHIGWDAFTHAGSPVVRSSEILRYMVGPVGGLTMPVYKLLQHWSTLAGLGIIVACLLRWMRRTPRMPYAHVRASAVVRNWFYAGVVLAGCAGAGAAMMRPSKSLEHLLFNIVVTGMTCTALFILAFCVWWQVGLRRNFVKG